MAWRINLPVLKPVPDALTPIEALLLQEEASQATNSKLNRTQAQRPKQEELQQQQQKKKNQKQQSKPGSKGGQQLALLQPERQSPASLRGLQSLLASCLHLSQSSQTHLLRCFLLP